MAFHFCHSFFFLIPKQHFLNIPLNDLKLYKENCESVSQSEMPWLTAEKQFCNIMQTACIWACVHVWRTKHNGKKAVILHQPSNH